MSLPNFFLAFLMLYFLGSELGLLPLGGLKSSGYDELSAFGKIGDVAYHLVIPATVLAIGSLAGLQRLMRGNMLEVLRMQYITTARAKGLHPIKLLWKYPVRVAINPLISTLGWQLPLIFSGSVIVAVVMGLPTTGPLLLDALMCQDMYLAGSMVMILATLTVIGTLISDILLLWLDPRIRYEKTGK